MTAAPEHDPLTIDPRTCGLCGLTMDKHRMVDDGDGPEFFCRDLEETADAAATVARWEMSDVRDRWKYTGEPMPPDTVPNADIIPLKTALRRYRTAQSTIDAFRYVLRQGDKARLKAWLAGHPRDAAFLLRSLEAD
jgi:hypothetical protein